MSLRFGVTIVIVAALAALCGPWLLPTDPAAQDLPLRLAAPSWRHPFGLDELGRDILARMLAGARVSFFVGTTVVLVSVSLGTLIGSLAGYIGGALDEGIGRVIDTLLAFPGLLLAIALVAMLGPGLVNVLLALTVIGWVSYARLVRGQILRAREFDYVHAARALGGGTLHVLWRHLIPTTLSALLVQASLGMAGAIIGEASLSFLGLGVQPPTPSWGSMLNGGRVHLLDAPHLTVFPGLAIALVVLGFNFLGDGLRELLKIGD
jgi:peptide/nickel transport system permease protein